MKLPITRLQMYLAKIAGHDVNVPAPITDEEIYLAEIAKSAGSGGSGSLPAVTSQDNGDVLTVVDGAWGKAAPSGGVFDIVISWDDDASSYTTEATYAQIRQAFTDGKSFRIIYDGYSIGFAYVADEEDDIEINEVHVSSRNDTVIVLGCYCIYASESGVEVEYMEANLTRNS